MTASTAERSSSERQPQAQYPSFTEVKERPINKVDYRQQGGPLLEYLWCEDEPLSGQSLYLGGEVGADGKIWFIPGHALRVLRLDPDTDQLAQVGPSFPGKFKWLRGVPDGNIIYGLPCHADTVLRIDVSTGHISTLPIPYEDFYSHEPAIAGRERAREWKYHGGNTCPIDGCIYAIPQSALHVLKVDPLRDVCELVGPALPGRYKWYGGVVGKQDGAIYGITHDSPSVLRIHPNAITLHGDYGTGGHKWHGAAAAPNGVIVCVPANADSVLCITPADPEPILTEVGDESFIQTGRHRNDNKYKYLGALSGTDGKVYVFPCGSERVLQVDTVSMHVKTVGPNIYDNKMERLCQNKWQNGVLSIGEQCVYGIPLAAESLLRIDCSKERPSVTTWPLPLPYKGLAKFEGGVAGPNGILYTVPNNHKAVLKIQPASWKEPKVFSGKSDRDMIQVDRDDPNLVYRSGIPTLRSSAHRVKFAPKNRCHDPKPKNRDGEETGTLWLPSELLKEHIFPFDSTQFDLSTPLRSLLRQCEPEIVGSFREGSDRLEDFVVPVPSTWRSVNGGQCERAQKYLSDQVATDEVFLAAFDRLVKNAVLPHLKARLVVAGAVKDETGGTTFYYQRPPTLRLQPGPAWAQVKPHNDAEYGHQNGELNFWLPLTYREVTGVDLWCETKFLADDFHPIAAKPGEVISFHGSSCRHYVNTNRTELTRVSMDFRVGVEGFFDPFWRMKGTTDDHGRTEVNL